MAKKSKFSHFLEIFHPKVKNFTMWRKYDISHLQDTFSCYFHRKCAIFEKKLSIFTNFQKMVIFIFNNFPERDLNKIALKARRDARDAASQPPETGVILG